MRNNNPATVSDLDIVAEKTYHNSKKLSQNDRQRRDEFVDLYGIEFSRNGSQNTPAVFHVSVSGDASYLERFQFKIVIEAFQSTAGSETSSVSLKENPDNVTGETLNLYDTLTPNPHKHSITPGMASIPVTTSNFHVYCEGIDITAYLYAQCLENGWNWFNGEGVYPSSDLEQSFDLLEVACDMKAEGREAQANQILKQGWKPITLSADAPFYATMVLYLKYQHMNR